MSSTLFFSFLGTNKYVPVHYELRDARTPKPEEFAQAAVIECLQRCGGPTIDRAVVAVTAAAHDQNLAALGARLHELGVMCTPIHIPDGNDEDELWQIFDRIGTAIAGAEHVVLDLTHGFRSLPVTGILALSFFRHVHAMKVDVYYGAFEVLGPAPAVREQAKDPSYHLDHQAPIFDLTPMFEIPPWAEAAAEWKRTGRADGIVERTKPYVTALRQQAPESLRRLADSLELLGDGLSLVRHDRIGPLAHRASACLEAASAEVAAHPCLAPLGHLLPGMKESVAPLVGPGLDWLELSDDYLHHQVAIARWMGDHGRVVEAFSFLREAVISCAVRIALAAGIPELPVGDALLPPEDKEYRGTMDGLVAMISGAIPGDAAGDVGDKLAAWLSAHPETRDAFRGAFHRVQPFRNRLDHCWFGPEHSRTNFSRSTADGVARKLGEGCDAVGRLVSTLGYAGGSCFLNLSNHPIDSWPEPQLRAARELGFGEPRDLDGGMPIVPPESTTEEVAAIARQLADRATELHAAGAHVSGDFSLTHALVLELQSRSIHCFAATTRRQSAERLREDGTVERTSLFDFVSWREYSDALS